MSVEVHKFTFEGNTAFSDDELAQLLETFVNRRITNDQLEEARLILVRHYVNQGYINSGAILPDQTVTDGAIKFLVIEGVLSDITVTGNERLKAGYVRKRIEHGVTAPLNMTDLRDRLEIIRQDPNIASVNAELKPGDLPGESLLDVSIDEHQPLSVGIEFGNNRSASLGAEQFDLLVSHTNLTGHGDALHIDYGITEGGLDHMDFAGNDELGITYSIPLNEDHLTLIIDYNRSNTLIVEEPFDTLDITSESESVAIAVRASLYRTPYREFAVTVSGERSTNETFLLGLPSSFSPGAQDGVSKITTLRFSQEWTERSRHSALAIRSTFSLGIDAFDATENPIRGLDGNRQADGKFFAWLGQLQYIQRLGDSSNQLVVRVSTQLADEPLMSAEQFSIGGLDTVRGYRKNQVVVDKGLVASIESRIPILFDTAGSGTFYLVPFLDVGLGKDAGGHGKSQEITSVGIGVLLQLNNRINAELYWGYPFRDFDNSNDDLQDKGILFRVAVTAF